MHSVADAVDEQLTTLSSLERHEITRIARGICARQSLHLNSDAKEDCHSEALLLLWQVRDRLAALPATERPAYAATCVRNELQRVLRKEHEHGRRTVSLDSDGLELLCSTGHETGASEWAALRRDNLLDAISRADLAAALLDLLPLDYDLLELTYLHEYCDQEIAGRLQISVTAVRVRRHRLLTRLRRIVRHREGT
jgi:RNA polymerase sigma factor (sigma-70 family)